MQKTYPLATRKFKDSSYDKSIIGEDSGRLVLAGGEIGKGIRLEASMSSWRYKSLESDDSIIRIFIGSSC